MKLALRIGSFAGMGSIVVAGSFHFYGSLFERG